MVLGDHGRNFLYPLTLTQRFASFPWAKMYTNSLYFRAFSATGVVLASAWAYIILKGKSINHLMLKRQIHFTNLIYFQKNPIGVDVSFTPYSAVHHSLGHKFAHDLEHLRYPVNHHHHDAKKH
jgi:hypothetical protein